MRGPDPEGYGGFGAPVPALSRTQLRAIDELTSLETAMIRTGYSRIISAAEFKAAYRNFANNLTYTTTAEDLKNESDLSCSDITVENSTIVIERAIQEEIRRHAAAIRRAATDTSFDLREVSGFGDSIPSFEELEEPVRDLKTHRLDTLLGKYLSRTLNRISHSTILQRIVFLAKHATPTSFERVIGSRSQANDPRRRDASRSATSQALAHGTDETHADEVKTTRVEAAFSRDGESSSSSSSSGSNPANQESNDNDKGQTGEHAESAETPEAAVSRRRSSRLAEKAERMAAQKAEHRRGKKSTTSQSIDGYGAEYEVEEAGNMDDEKYQLKADQVLLRVAIYDPLTQSKSQEFLVLDDQPLTALRDAIVCAADDIDRLDWTTQQFREGCKVHGGGCQCGATEPPKEVDYRRLLNPRPRACDLPTPSGFFFIEDCFYDDMRSKNAIRYSDPIVDWLCQTRGNQPLRSLTIEQTTAPPKASQRSNVQGSPDAPRFCEATLAPATQAEMETTSFGDLRIRLGSHYLYQHQGNCTHVLIFTEMRCIAKGDVTDRRMYPLEVFSRRERIQKCLVCELFPAEFVLYNDKLFDQSPTFVCGHCYRLSHEDVDGNLLYNDFQVYRTLPLPIKFKSVADWEDTGAAKASSSGGAAGARTGGPKRKQGRGGNRTTGPENEDEREDDNEEAEEAVTSDDDESDFDQPLSRLRR